METLDTSLFMKMAYGKSTVPYEGFLNYGYALLTIAGADGQVTKPEMNWLVRHLYQLGAPESVLDAMRDFDHTQADLTEMLANITVDDPSWAVKRSLLYDAIRIARADRNFAPAERQALDRMAKLLQIEPEVALAIDNLVSIEEGLHGMRRALFHSEKI